MIDQTAEYERRIEDSRLAIGRGDRIGAEVALTAAIQITDGVESLQRVRADALMRLGALEQDVGNLVEAERLLREALQAKEQWPDLDDTALISTLTALGQVLVARGEPEEAQTLLSKALELRDKTADSADADLVVLLNELSRLFLKQAAYVLAEPLLLRLLSIKRMKGDEHPEAATVLASLGAVRQALGDSAGAEQRYRHALRIREKSLAPNHFSIAATLEHLADAVAARGNLSEAISFSQRALVIREPMLGANHPTVRAARERIADLQLQESDGLLPSGERADEIKAAAPSCHGQPEEHATERPVGEEVSRSPTGQLPWANELMAIQQEMAGVDPRDEPRAVALLPNAMARTIGARPWRATLSVAGGIVLLAAAFGLKSYFGKTDDRQVYVEAAPAAASSGKPVTKPTTEGSSAPAAAAPHLPAEDIASSEPSRPSAGRVNRPSAPPPPLPRPVLPVVTLPSLDVATRITTPPVKTIADSFPAGLSLSGSGKGNALVGDAESSRALTMPRLIGAPPQPRYPDRLRELRVEGEVLVEFTVDDKGRPDVSSMKVVHSPHETLTSAVRDVLTQFRFEPARTAPPESRPRPETVKYAFTFHVPAR